MTNHQTKQDDTAKLISFSEISKILPHDLTSFRSIQRDIHYSVINSIRDKKYVNEERPYNPNPVYGDPYPQL